jgi:hypothetical protein
LLLCALAIDDSRVPNLGFVSRLISLAAISAGVACAGADVPASSSAPVTPIDVAPASSSAASAPAPALASASSPPASAKDTCAAECRAQPSEALIEAIGLNARKAHRCYDQALVRDRALKGHVQIHLTVAADGHVCTATAEKALTDAPMSAVADCVAGFFRALTLAAPLEDGCSDLSLPIAFVPRADDAGAP